MPSIDHDKKSIDQDSRNWALRPILCVRLEPSPYSFSEYLSINYVDKTVLIVTYQCHIGRIQKNTTGSIPFMKIFDRREKETLNNGCIFLILSHLTTFSIVIFIAQSHVPNAQEHTNHQNAKVTVHICVSGPSWCVIN